jgi:capsular polysaccharide transport system permease protein
MDQLVERGKTTPSPTPQLDDLEWRRTSGLGHGSRYGWRRLNGYRLTFIACVLVPTVASAVYFITIAPPEYVSEAKFAVRSVIADNAAMTNSLSNVGGSAVPSAGKATSTSPTASSLTSTPSASIIATTAAMQEGYIVTDYIRSRTIISDIGGKDVLKKYYSHSNVDWLSRLTPSATQEGAWRYWNRKVSATIEAQSNIVTLDVAAFSPKEAQQLTQTIVESSEKLVNEISERSRRDAMKRAEEEVEKTRQRLSKARTALAEFRNSSNVIDPMLSATSISDTIMAVTKDKIALENSRDSLQGMVAKDSPTRRLLDAQIEAKTKQIDELQEQLTSQTRVNALSGKIASYTDLTLESQFAERLYSIAQAALQQARLEAERQQIYLALVVKPTLPEEVAYPRVFVDTALIFATLLVIWSMGALLVSAIRDHVD